MRRTTILRHTASAAVVGAVAFGFAGAASAQSTPQASPTTVDDIIVTAQKREQNLQDVPIVVTSLNQETLNNAGVRDIKDLQILTPGMTVTSTQSESSTTARIRGVGTVGDNPGLESSVGVVIDGVYRSRNGVGFGDLGELSRIEVLKGPQGTLFGKNTSAGVINIITEAPAFTPGYTLEATAGNFGAWGVAASATGPITDNLAFRLYGAKRERDGFYDVDTGDGPRSETDDQNQDMYTLRGQLLWLPSDDVSMRLIADYSKRDEYCCTGVQIRTANTYPFVDLLSNGTGQRPPVAGFGRLPFSRQAFANRNTHQPMEDRGVSLETTIDLPSMNATFTSLTSYRNWETKIGMDIDYTGADILYRDDDGRYSFQTDTITQEFRLAGQSERLDWLVGLFGTKEGIRRGDSYFYGEDYTPFLSYLLTARLNAANPAVPISPDRIPCFTAPGQTAAGLGACLVAGVGATGPGFGTGLGAEDLYKQDAESLALFTNNTIKITDAFDVTVGLRLTHDAKELQARQTNQGTNGLACASAAGNAAAIGGALGAANAGAIIGNFCLPWANAAFADRRIRERDSDTNLSGTIKGSYRFNDSVMAYASYARGYKGFGYNLDRVQGPTATNPIPINPLASVFFPAETADSYEIGLKTTLFNRTVLLNATYFDQTFNDFQLNTFLGTAFVVESIPELRSKGVDADFLWFTPIEGLSFGGGVTYTDSKYGDFTAADLANPGNFAQLSLLPGARASFAPEWSATGQVNFDRSVGAGLRAGFSLSAKYSSEYNTGSDLLPWKMQDSMTLVNGRISIGSEDERWVVDIWGQNITDEEYLQVAYNAPLQGTAFQTTVQPNGTFYNPALDTQTYNAYLGQPRTYGVTLRLRY